jgi:hypothetical protein
VTRRRLWLFRSLYLVWLLALVALLELGLRLLAPIPLPKGMYYPPTWLQRSDNPAKGYEPRPGAAGLNIAGFRGPEIAIERSPGVGRVAVIGDSVAWGLGVTPDQTYAALLPSRLEALTGQAWEAYDMGVPGYGTVQIVEHFRERGLAYDPDVVVYGYWFNDFHQLGCNDYHFPFFSGLRASAWELYVQALLRWPWVEGLRDTLLGSQILLRTVDLRYRLGTHGWRERGERATRAGLGSGDPDMERFYGSWTRVTSDLAGQADVAFLDAFLMEAYGRSAQQSFEEYWAALLELRTLCEERDIRLIVVVTPVLRDLNDYDYQPLHGWVGELCAHLDIELLDTLPAFQQAGYRTPRPPPGEPPDVAHPTPEGHRIVAEALAEHLAGEAEQD